MRKNYFWNVSIIICGMAFTSCASILNKPDTKLNIHSKTPSKIVYLKDTLQTENNLLQLVVPRSKSPLELEAITDSITKKLTIYPKKSLAYYANLAVVYGFLFDGNKPKTYTYPADIYTDRDYNPKMPRAEIGKGDFRFDLTIPYLNTFTMQPKGEGNKSTAGFFGIGGGVDYFHSDKQFLNVSAAIASDFPIPVPAPLYRDDDYTQMNSSSFSISNNHLLRRFSLGYGVAFHKNEWTRYYKNPENEVLVHRSTHKTNDALGLLFSSYYRAGRNFHLGLVYKPSFIGLSSGDAVLYEHAISIELAWKFRL